MKTKMSVLTFVNKGGANRFLVSWNVKNRVYAILPFLIGFSSAFTGHGGAIALFDDLDDAEDFCKKQFSEYDRLVVQERKKRIKICLKCNRKTRLLTARERKGLGKSPKKNLAACDRCALIWF